MNINGMPPLNPLATQAQTAKKPGNFSALMKQYTNEVNHDVKTAAKAATTLAVKGEGNVSETMIAVKEAGLSFQLMMAARNKVVDAYREVIRMQV